MITMTDDSKLIIRGYEIEAYSVPTIAHIVLFEIADYARTELGQGETAIFQTGETFYGWKGPLMIYVTNKGRTFDIKLIVTEKTKFIIETPTKHIAKRWKVDIPVKPRYIKGKNAHELMCLYPGLPYHKLMYYVPRLDIKRIDIETELHELLTNDLYYNKDFKLVYPCHNMAIIFKGKID